jgi:ATPase subunit of ABC transporter with duplicated ATPase domains
MSEVAQSTNFLNMATEDEEHVTEEEAGMMADLIVNAMRKKAREDREAEQEELAAVVNAADETSSASSSASSNSKRSRECNSETREAEAEEEEEEEVTDFAIFEETDYCGGCDYALKHSSEELRFLLL